MRIPEFWECLFAFVRQEAAEESKPDVKNLLQDMANPFTEPYLAFLEYIFKIFNVFNLHFQSAGTRVHEMHFKSMEFLKEIASHFIKPQLLNHIDFVKQIDFSLPQNQIVLDDIELERGCNLLLRQILEVTLEEIENMKKFRMTCLNFYTNSVMVINKRFPMDDEFLKKLEVFSGPKALFDSNRLSTFEDVSFISKELGAFDEEELQKEWSVLPEDLSLLFFVGTQNFDDM